jgi:hypothetical protein
MNRRGRCGEVTSPLKGYETPPARAPRTDGHLSAPRHPPPRHRFAKAVAPLGVDVSELLPVRKENPRWRRAVQHYLHEHFWKASGALHYTPFFIVSPGAHRSYWLLHLANHPKARDVMTQLHWSLANHFVHHGAAGLDLLGYHPHDDTSLSRQEAFAFDGSARDRTARALRQDLPEHLWRCPDGVPFSHLFRTIVNGTPAHSGMIKDAIVDLVNDGALVIRGPEGGMLRRLDRVEDGTLIFPNRQVCIDFGR